MSSKPASMSGSLAALVTHLGRFTAAIRYCDNKKTGHLGPRGGEGAAGAVGAEGGGGMAVSNAACLRVFEQQPSEGDQHP